MTDQTVAKTALTQLALFADAYDMSWSFSATGDVEERALFFFEASDQAARILASSARTLDCPDNAISEWSEQFRGADALGLTVNADLTSVRLYTQYWDQQVARVLDGNVEPFALYRGSKLLPDGSLRHDVYTCQPLAPPEVFIPSMRDQLAAFGVAPEAFTSAFENLTAENCVYTTISGNGRSSWLVTVRKAPVKKAALIAALNGLPDCTQKPRIFAQAKAHDLLHVAGGTDPVKGAFLSLYFEATDAEVRAFLNL